jgi:hypothetical protein
MAATAGAGVAPTEELADLLDVAAESAAAAVRPRTIASPSAIKSSRQKVIALLRYRVWTT